MKTIRPTIIVSMVFAVIVGTSCSRHTINSQPAPQNSQLIHHATGFNIIDQTDYREVIINEPFKDAVLTRYYLVTDNNVPTPDDGTKLVIPLKHIGIASCTHIGFMEALDLLDRISGICLPNSIYSSQMRTRYESGDAIDMGDAMKIDPEKALLANADAIMISGYGQGDVNPEKLNKVGITVIYNNEWTEHTPLGRAEWIKLVGALFCKDSLANDIFSRVESEYLAASNSELTTHNSRLHLPTIMSGNNFRGTWYMSSGDSWTGRLYADAGADYYFKNDSTQGSIPLSIESVLQHFGDADVWVGSNGHSLEELAQSDKKHTWFKAYKNHRVYNFYRRQNDLGANDYWERGVVHPEEILKDLIWALYPEEHTDYQPIYIRQLQ